MAAVIRESADQYRVLFGELGRRGLGRLRPREKPHVDPYLIARAVAEVMRACTVRSALGCPLLWNEYRVILSRADFEPLRALYGTLERDLREVLTAEVQGLGAELVGELRVTLVVDEADELEPGDAVVRVAFVPTERFAASRAGEMTVQFDTRALGANAPPAPGGSTLYVPDSGEQAAGTIVLRWPSGEAALPAGIPFVVGRPHPDAPARFVALTGASARINKQHLVMTAGFGNVRIGRLPSANPVHVDGRLLSAGEEIEASIPLEISLSRGELVIAVSGVSGARQ